MHSCRGRLAVRTLIIHALPSCVGSSHQCPPFADKATWIARTGGATSSRHQSFPPSFHFCSSQIVNTRKSYINRDKCLVCNCSLDNPPGQPRGQRPLRIDASRNRQFSNIRLPITTKPLSPAQPIHLTVPSSDPPLFLAVIFAPHLRLVASVWQPSGVLYTGDR